MRRRLLALLGVASIVTALVTAASAPAGAAEGLAATSVALSDSADCSDEADLDIGLDVDVTTDLETGTITNLDGVIGSFENPGSDWAGTDEVYEGYGQPIDDPQPEGTIIGSYASIGTEPLSATSAIEWFVLYRCSDVGDNVVLYDCFGDLGTCPGTAAEGLEALFGGTVSPTQVAPGGTLTVDGEGCVLPLAGAVLLRDGTGIGVGDVVEPAEDGSFLIELVVPADLAPGPLTVQIDCGFDGDTVLSDTVEVEVVGPVAPTTAPPTTAAPAPVVVTPRFTG